MRFPSFFFVTIHLVGLDHNSVFLSIIYFFFQRKNLADYPRVKLRDA